MGPASGRKWGPIHANGLVGHPIDWCSSVVRNRIPSNNLAMVRGKGPVAVLMLQTSWSCWIVSTALVTFWKAVRPPTTAILQAVGKPTRSSWASRHFFSPPGCAQPGLPGLHCRFYSANLDLLVHGSLNVPIFHITQPLDSIRYMVYNGYYKVMSNIPKMGHLTTPVVCF